MLSSSYWFILYITGTRPWPRPQSISISCATNPHTPTPCRLPLEQPTKWNLLFNRLFRVFVSFFYPIANPKLSVLFVPPKTFLLTRQTNRLTVSQIYSKIDSVSDSISISMRLTFYFFCFVYCHLFYVYSFSISLSLPISMFLVYSKKRSWITPAVQIFQ